MTQNAWNSNVPVEVAKGGTALSTLTAHAVYVGNGTSAPTALSVGADHSLLIGNTGADPAFTTTGTPYVTGISFDAGTTTLSAYASGSWTPSISLGGGTTGITYAVQTGQYVRVGKICYITCQITLSSKGSSTGVLLVTNLPFTVSSATPVVLFSEPGAAVTFDVGFTYLGALTVNSSTTMGIYEAGSNVTLTQLTDANLANNSNFTVSGAYGI